MKAKLALVVVAALVGGFVVWSLTKGARINSLVCELSDADAARREAIVDQLAKEEAAPVLPLIAAMPGQNKDVTLAMLRALEANLEWCAEEAFVMLPSDFLKSRRAEREAARPAVQAAVPVLVAMLESPDADIRTAALEALATPYRALISADQVSHYLPVLQRMVRDPSGRVRLATVQLASRVLSRDAERLVLAATDDDDKAVRATAIDSTINFLRLGKGVSLPPTIARRIASELLRRIDELAASQKYVCDPMLRDPMDTLIKAGALGELEGLFDHPDSDVAYLAADALLDHNEAPSAIKALLAIARGDGPRKSDAEELLINVVLSQFDEPQPTLEQLENGDPVASEELQKRHAELVKAHERRLRRQRGP